MEEKNKEYYESLDKRTKEYKDWVASFEEDQESKPDGLGDVVETITEKTGIKKLVKMVVGEDCGCDERKEKLNKIFPANKPLCLEEEEYIYLKEWFSKNRITVKPLEQQKLLSIYNRVLRYNQKPTNCASCFKEVVHRLKKYLEAYESAE